MINKHFYAFRIEGEPCESPYQLYFSKKDFYPEVVKPEHVPHNTLELRNGLLMNPYTYKDLFIRVLFSTHILEVSSYLDYHYEQYLGEKEDFVKMIGYIFSPNNKQSLCNRYDDPEELVGNIEHSQIQDHFVEVRNWLEKHNPNVPLVKLSWKAGPAQFGYIFQQLYIKGFIDYPGSGGDYSPLNFAKHCLNHFDIDTTLNTLSKELSPRFNSVGDKISYRIPELKSKKKS